MGRDVGDEVRESRALGLAMRESGTAVRVARLAEGVFGGGGPWVMLAVIYLLAAVLTELISNNAVAALLTPIAITVAQAMPGEIDPRPFVVAVMFGASASFSTPIGYQTNMMVYGPGGYRFVDFMKVGIPLNLTVGLLASLLIPLIWPL